MSLTVAFLDYLGTTDNNKSKRIKHGSRALFLPRKIFLKTSKITLCLLSMCCLFISVSSFHKCKKKNVGRGRFDREVFKGR